MDIMQVKNHIHEFHLTDYVFINVSLLAVNNDINCK